MAVPSRAFVGMVVFGLLASLAVVPYTLLVLSGYEAPPNAPYQALFPGQGGLGAGDKLVLVLASLFCVAVTVFAWRGLLGRARADVELRSAAQRRRDEDAMRPPPPPPPGYQ